VQNVVLVPHNSLKQFIVHIFSSAAVRISERHSPERTPRRITASTRCRSAAVAKPHQALAAYVSLATTTHRKTVCVSSWHMYAVCTQCSYCMHRLRAWANNILTLTAWLSCPDALSCKRYFSLLHDLLCPPVSHRSVITAFSLTPVKRDGWNASHVCL